MSGKRIKYSKELLEPIVKESYSLAQVLKKLGLGLNGGSYDTVKKKIEQFSIDDSHFKGQSWSKDRPHLLKFSKEKFIKEVLILNGKGWRTDTIKKRLYEYGMKEEKCEKCNIEDWQGKPLSFHLHHKNGNNKDNRIENLENLCPNCHSQTDNYGVKNIGNYADVVEG